MTYMRRKIDAYLEQWKQSNNRKPLIVKGPRQCGKTESIRQFAKNNYPNIVEINFALHPEYKHIAETSFSVDAIVNQISFINPSAVFAPGETLLFFDEITEYPELLTSLKSFREDGRFDVICSGSLLGIQYNRISSISVGSKQEFDMTSMDFEEFLWALGYPDSFIDSLYSHLRDLKPFSPFELERMEDLFLTFCTLGGMPEVVSQYVQNRNFSGSLQVQKELVTDYFEDIQKYAESLDKARITEVLQSVPSQLAKDNTVFYYSKIKEDARKRDYPGCVQWLSDAGIVLKCCLLNNAELPVSGNVDQDKFKLYYFDTGLLISQLDDETQRDFRMNKNLGIYKGALYENIAAEALFKQNLPLVYYKKGNSTLEMDFFVRSADDLICLEVKSTNSKAKSMKALMENPKYHDIHYGIKVRSGNISASSHVLYIPHFCLFLLNRLIHDVKIGELIEQNTTAAD